VKILNHYISHSFLVTFTATVAVFTFVFSIGGLFKLSELVSKGVDWHPIVKIFASGIPSALAVTIPISMLTSTLLVFGRLSADSEITAIKACGISMWRVVRWMLPISILLTVICLYVNSDIVPYSHFLRRSALSKITSGNPVDLVEEGRTIEAFDGLTLYVGSKSGDQLYNIRIYDRRESGRMREIKAKSGVVSVVTNSMDILLELKEVTIDPFSFDRPGAAYAGKWPVLIENSKKHRSYSKKSKDMKLAELFVGIRDLDAEVLRNSDNKEVVDDILKRRMKMSVEMHKRIAVSCSCLTFMFLGIPFGVRSHRKESSVGIALSLALVFCFYLFVLVAEQLAGKPALHPDMMTWLPVVLSLVTGGILIHRIR
jgi:lipopolysaccharide export system permease protein